MDKTEAILVLLNEIKVRRTSTAGARRCVRACKALGLDNAETIRVLGWLDFCDADGEPYSDRVHRVWA